MDLFWTIISVISGIALFAWIAFLFSGYINTAILFVVKLIAKKEYSFLESKYFKIMQIPLTIIMFFVVIWLMSILAK